MEDRWFSGKKAMMKEEEEEEEEEERGEEEDYNPTFRETFVAVLANEKASKFPRHLISSQKIFLIGAGRKEQLHN